ncbi:Uncharacterised protein [Legionella busanensis]|uniref:Uncharacterized protein n=1 Tax=Legionella busanensis TaxID=190655 RepID=A0A378JG63_9GAMM|nr:hypothetical protein [Legionella busanensis]STX49967.1 Uncharacterised protein [Legionella busanensis]
MPLPSKALRYGQLVFKSAGEAVPTSGHEVFKVEFIDTAGEIKKGFYKPLAPSYPRILAQYSVASSVFMSTFVDRVAEERLVLNDQDEVIGTASIAIPDFKPLLQWTDPTPTDPQEKELVCPSVESLLLENFAEFIAILLTIGEDDEHPKNISTRGLIDRDMSFYDITYIMKGGRLSDSFLKDPPEILMRIRGSQLDNLPNSLPGTHSPARTIPANGNVTKIYKNFAEFQKLATNPSLLTEKGTISFQDQLFHAFLKQLILFDPELIRARLEHYFGDIKFDYSCLDEKQRSELKRIHPTYFQPKFEGQETFIDHMMKVLYDRYQQLYKAVVFYPGCPKNESGVSVVSFSDYLRNKPSAFGQIMSQVDNKNEKMKQAWDAHQDVSDKKNDEDFIYIKKPSDMDAFLFNPNAWFKSVKIEQRYHQVWRDSLIFLIKDSLSQAKQLTKELIDKLSIKPIVSSQTDKINITLDDPTLIKAAQLLEENDLDIDPLTTNCDKENSILLGLQELINFRKSLKKAALDYYKLERHELTIEKNQEFYQLISAAIGNYENKIHQYLKGTSWSIKFGELMSKILNLYGTFNLQRHLSSVDAPIESKVRHNYAELLQIPHTHESVVSEAIKALFDWVNKLDKETFNGAISSIITEYYSASSLNILSNRYREEPVTQYLKTSTDNNANKLAFILSSGGHSSTSLNTQLIKHLMTLFVSKTISSYTVSSIEDKTLGAIDVNLISVEYACERGNFNENIYTLHAIKYAKEDQRFTHLYSDYSLTRFNKWMYKWVDSLERSAFEDIIKKALKEYEPLFSFFSRRQRGENINQALKDKNHSNSGILANIFTQGETNSSSFNTILFKLLLKIMQTTISISKGPNLDAQLVMQVARDDIHIQHYLKSLATYAKDQTWELRPALTGHPRSITTNVAVL